MSIGIRISNFSVPSSWDHGMQLCWFPELTLYGAITPERAERGTMRWAIDATTAAFRETQRSHADRSEHMIH